MTSSPPTADSTSTPALPSRVQLRRQAPAHTGVRVEVERTVSLADGSATTVYPGDWVVHHGRSAITVIRKQTFPSPFEIVQPNTLTLTHEERQAIEAVTGLGTTATGRELVAAVQRLAKLSIGEVNIPFTPGQIEELKHRADKRGHTLEQEVQAVIDRIKDELFWGGAHSARHPQALT